MITNHFIFYKDARNMDALEDNSVHLVVTSPPYPMIAMWDDIFIKMNMDIQAHLKSCNGMAAFGLMHVELAKTWAELYRVLVPGGFACINIGDATRTIGKQFRLYPNHISVLSHFNNLGFETLPSIIWRKPTNSPTKFLGSGMLPCGGYVTLEHEWILVFRKPDKRKFKSTDEIQNRYESSFFWEERNEWFSDIWKLNGIRQKLNEKKIRKRSGAFPLEIPFRLINMFSSKLDTVLDPFLGTATTTLASIICGRNSIGYEFDKGFRLLHHNEISSPDIIKIANDRIEKRINDHLKKIDEYKLKGKIIKYKSSKYGFPVITRQEINMKLEKIKKIVFISKQKSYKATYSK